uniref:Receptor activity-modifying protein 3 n=1 Tax=Salvator merianae TaxID=96440 RepID=A0A8D0KDJ7_SALMN
MGPVRLAALCFPLEDPEQPQPPPHPFPVASRSKLGVGRGEAGERKWHSELTAGAGGCLHVRVGRSRRVGFGAARPPASTKFLPRARCCGMTSRFPGGGVTEQRFRVGPGLLPKCFFLAPDVCGVSFQSLLALLPVRARSRMELHAFWLLQLFFCLLWGAQQGLVCNESLMLQNLPLCGKSFEEMMQKVDSKKWCNLTEFIRYYSNFTSCTEHKAVSAKCFWPNPLAEGFITGIHRQFFSNCTSEKAHWEDPPDRILITLIFLPIFLTVAMIGLVVWCSKRSDILV